MIKTAFDLLFSFILLVILSPFIIIIAVLVKLTSKGPAVFKHKRSGLNGKIFFVYKFRTMVDGAHRKGPGLTEKNDPRITRTGAFLRKTSLDELPQLFNILKGEMSFVGPRPEIPEIVKKYTKFQQQVLSVKPGLTGLPQVNGRADLSIPKKLRMDVYYVKNHRLMMDLKIILKTIYVVITRKGAF